MKQLFIEFEKKCLRIVGDKTEKFATHFNTEIFFARTRIMTLFTFENYITPIKVAKIVKFGQKIDILQCQKDLNVLSFQNPNTSKANGN